MPVPRKPIRVADSVSTASSKRLPSRIVVFVVVRDESGSMSRWRQRQGEFIPAVRSHLLEAGGPKVGEAIFLLHCVVSGGVVTTEFEPLAKASDPEFTPDGQTPIGRALEAVADKCRAFLESKVYPQEVAVRNLEILIVSDLQATGETSAETEAGVRRFVDFINETRGKVTVVGPDPEAMNHDLAKQIDLSGRGTKYLDSDPNAVLDITFDSIVAASRIGLGGSNSAIRIR